MATFGKTTIGVNSSVFLTGTKALTLYTLTEEGVVTSITMYFGSSGFNARVAIYNRLNAKLLVQSNVEPITVVGWHTFSIPETTLQAGEYGLAWKVDVSATVAWDTGVINQAAQNTEVFNGFSDPFGVATQFSSAVSIYATYTPTTPQAPPISPLVILGIIGAVVLGGIGVYALLKKR